MQRYEKLNVLTGWAVFLVAAFTYVSTIEPTTSFWDCGEFITSAYKLEVGHPPGAPVFMMLGRLFTLLALGDASKAAMMVNLMSALASAFTIMFLFWTITHMAKKLVLNDFVPLARARGYVPPMPDMGQGLAILGSGVVGALAYTFSDTFWFSAVEGEVYAMSSLFTAMVFWAILKWESQAHLPGSNRWIVLIAFLVGLSIGVHLLNLLAIPAMVFVYYFKRYEVTRGGVLAAAGISVAILGATLWGVIKLSVSVASKFELLFVNGLGLPIKSGLVVFLALVFAALGYLLVFSYKKAKPMLNLAMTALLVILIGYSSFALIVIRSAANPPMDQNNPEHMFTLLSYLNREQYGENPLVRGQYFNAPVVGYKDGPPIYALGAEGYKVVDNRLEREFDPRYTTIFPRMYSDSPSHQQGYMMWAGMRGTPEAQTSAPRFSDNLSYFFKYQVGYMYMRYFLWNFAGRQNDIQGSTGEVTRGNWISGVPAIDQARLGDQDLMPEPLRNNRANNKYFFLPLVLGLLGMALSLTRGQKDFVVLLLFFFFTGLAIVLYTNQPPYQPRERDYAYAGSFYVFAIWIGLGVLALYEALRLWADGRLSAVASTALALAAVPTLMAFQNWDDHDRSNRYTARDFARNYLESCAPNAIIFTNGDNDTFPLWYAQEVEGIRTDVRVVNLSYLSTDWYIEGMTRQAYESEPLPISLTYDQYEQGQREVVYIQEQIDDYRGLGELLEFVKSDDRSTKVQLQSGDEYDFLPTRKIKLAIDKQAVLANGAVPLADTGRVVTEMRWELGANYLRKAELVVLDMIATNNWERPIYFAITVGRENFMNLEKYFQLEGMAYRLVPVENTSADGQVGGVNHAAMYENLMQKFTWGGLDNPSVYLDENNSRMAMNLRNNFYRLADKFIALGQNDKAIEVLDKCAAIMPDSRVEYNYYNLLMSDSYFRAGAAAKGADMSKTVAKNSLAELDFYLALDQDKYATVQDDAQRAMLMVQECINMCRIYEQEEAREWIEGQYMGLAQKYNM